MSSSIQSTSTSAGPSSIPHASSSSPSITSIAARQSGSQQERATPESANESSPPKSDVAQASDSSVAPSKPTSEPPPPSSSKPPSASAPPPQSASNSEPKSQSQSAAPQSITSTAPPSSSITSGSDSSIPPSASAPTPTPTPTPSPVPLAASGSDSVSVTGSISFTTIVTSVNGQLTTIVSPLPTSLSTASASKTNAQRTAIIAGATAAGVGVVLFLLGAVFVYKRSKGRRREFSEAIGRFRREAHGAGGVGLLDDEGFDDDDDVPMRRYRDNVIAHPRSGNTSAASLGTVQSPAPSLFRQRAENGSIFREEGVYPPPQGEHVDPLVGLGSSDFGRIVDDVMGPSDSPDSIKPPAPPPQLLGHVPTMSSATSSLYNDPFRDLSHSKTPSNPSLYYDRRGASSSMSHHSRDTSTSSRPHTPQSLLGLPAGTANPKKPSPLANPHPPSAAATWLTRSPKKPASSVSQ